MVSKFKQSLPILRGKANDPKVKLGVCAMGPVAPGDKLTWMRVWVYQNVNGKAAAASGTSGTHLGSHAPSDKEKLPFTEDREWMIQTELERGSAQFSAGKPALAMAMAIVKHKKGGTEVEHWSQPVMIGAGYRRGDGPGH